MEITTLGSGFCDSSKENRGPQTRVFKEKISKIDVVGGKGGGEPEQKDIVRIRHTKFDT